MSFEGFEGRARFLHAAATSSAVLSALVIQTLAWVSLLTDQRGYFQKVLDKLNCRRRGRGTPRKSSQL